MRKTVRMLGVLALVAVVLTVTPARAEGAAYVGQPIGMVRWSDVKVDIDGMPIRAYELAGCHLVVCEDLPAYGFWVSWDPNVRVVDVRTLEMPERPPVPVDSGGEPGSFAATIYASDIVTYVNGRRIASYNLGGGQDRHCGRGPCGVWCRRPVPARERVLGLRFLLRVEPRQRDDESARAAPRHPIRL